MDYNTATPIQKTWTPSYLHTKKSGECYPSVVSTFVSPHEPTLKTIAGEVVNRRSVLLRKFVLNGQESNSNPLLHIHAKRWQQGEKAYCHERYAENLNSMISYLI